MRRSAACLLALSTLAVSACSAAVEEVAEPATEVALDRDLAVEAVEALDTRQAAEPAEPDPVTTTTTSPPEPPPPPTEPPPPPTEPPPPPQPAVAERQVVMQSFTPFATVGGIVLLHPSAVVERVAFHESGHDGARQLDPLEPIVAPMILESRGRGTGDRTAADIVVDPEVEIRAPVTGTVKRAGTYVLYCDYSDDYLVIAPDERPDWEVKVLHIDGVTVRAGDRVVAGETVVAPRPTILPFESQVDEFRTAEPAWPHVHIEVVDPSIPNTPKGGGC